MHPWQSLTEAVKLLESTEPSFRSRLRVHGNHSSITSLQLRYLHISNPSVTYLYLDISQGTLKSSRQLLFYKQPQAAYTKYHFNVS